MNRPLTALSARRVCAIGVAIDAKLPAPFSRHGVQGWGFTIPLGG